MARELSGDEREQLRGHVEHLLLNAQQFPPCPGKEHVDRDPSKADASFAILQEFADLVATRCEQLVGGVAVRNHFAIYFLQQVIIHAVEEEADDDYRQALLAAQHLALAPEETEESSLEELARSTYEAMISAPDIAPPSVDDGRAYTELLANSVVFRRNFGAHHAGYDVGKHALRPARDPRGRLVAAQVTRYLRLTLESRARMVVLWKRYTWDFYTTWGDGFVPAVAPKHGPQRDLYSYHLPPEEPVLNSIRDHPRQSNTSSFFRVKRLENGEVIRPASSEVILRPGDSCRCVVYICDDTAVDAEEGAKDVVLRIDAPKVIAGSKQLRATLSASNTEHPRVWDSVVITMTKPEGRAWARLCQKSLKLYNLTTKREIPVENIRAVFREGIQIPAAESTRDGTRPTYALTFDIQADYPNFEVKARARISEPGTDDEFREFIKIRPGQIMEVEVTYTNTGSVKQNGVELILNELPLPLRAYPSKVRITRSSDPDTTINSDDSLKVDRRIKLDQTHPSEVLTMLFYLKVADNADDSFFYRQGTHWVNMEKFASIATQNGTKHASLDVLIHAEHGATMPTGYFEAIAEEIGEA
ncbi:hypothetical protein HGQ17_01175 [Nesterenkonia sp. MY13]|uniref:Uncharacterized protein n=1 Tax=Nesterenkonia sedimenti TaxID=1463632 RepID=A0A7X8TH54_9MICC|nr:hypothetical protein [Nesterenkonia sedimenti]NLS08637.1 hypothetical protein [Nesterenkonia sedimenti]